MSQWRERSAWSEEHIGAIPRLGRRLVRLGPGIFQPVHAERYSVRIIVPHGSGLESLRALAKDGMVVGVDGLRVGLTQHVQEGLARGRQGFVGGQSAFDGAAEVHDAPRGRVDVGDDAQRGQLGGRGDAR